MDYFVIIMVIGSLKTVNYRGTSLAIVDIEINLRWLRVEYGSRYATNTLIALPP